MCFGLTWYVLSLYPSFRFLKDVSQLTSAPPAFGLGLEPAEPSVMLRPPHDIKHGVFTWPVIIDTVSYGVAMGATSLLAVSN